MSYIAFDLDALNVVPDVAAASGLTPGEVAHGLLKLWAWCFRNKTDKVNSTHIAGFFGGQEAAHALAAFGFLESVIEGGGWRIRGADRYLKVSKQRSEAGKARSSSAGRSAGRFTSTPPAADQRSTSGGPALTPSTKHLTPNTKSKSIAPDKPAPPPPTPGWQLLVDRMVQAFPGYAFTGHDAKMLKVCLDMAKGDGEEVVVRWCRALTRTGYPEVRSIAELQKHWNRFGATPEREPLPVFERTEEVQF